MKASQQARPRTSPDCKHSTGNMPNFAAPSATALPADPTFVIGHRNPDADSICSAIAYAAFKTSQGDAGYVPARCGNTNARIDAILHRFHQPLPVYLSDVWPRVEDLMDSAVATIPSGATCAEALDLFDRHNASTLPVVDAVRRVTGVLSLAHLGGLFIPRVNAPRHMRAVESSLADIARALKATVICAGDAERREELHVRLGTMDISSFCRISEKENLPAGRSLLIVGDRRDIQLRAIEKGLRGIILTCGAIPDREII